MDVIAECYPVGIGKHIVCIDACRKAAAAIQTAYRGEPRTPINFNSGSSAESRGKTLNSTTKQK